MPPLMIQEAAISPAASTTVVDLAFALRGESVLRDHGYLLYAALARVLPFLHEATDVGVHPLHGEVRNGRLLLGPHSTLQLRLPIERLAQAAALMRSTLEVGDARLEIGAFRAYPLRPRTTLRSRLVTIKGFLEPDPFREALLRQAEEWGISSEWSLGARRVMVIHGRTVVGFEVLAEALNCEDSLRLQQVGLGGRRKMGCGLFVPCRS